MNQFDTKLATKQVVNCNVSLTTKHPICHIIYHVEILESISKSAIVRKHYTPLACRVAS